MAKKPVKKPVTKEQLLGDPITDDYSANPALPWYYMQRQRPIFSPLLHVPLMLPDARIQFGLTLIRGSIKSLTKFVVKCEDAEVAQYVQTQVDRFWACGLTSALRQLEWGWSANEVMYKEDEATGDLYFDRLKDIQSCDTRAVVFKSKRIGCTVRGSHATNEIPTHNVGINRLFIGGPKLLWCVHRRDIHPYYGQPRIYGAFLPWWEKWSEGGYRDMRRLWYYRHSFAGPTMRHPEGVTQYPDGSKKLNKDIARTIGEYYRSGALITMPSTKDTSGNFLWDKEEAEGKDTPGGLLDYGEDINLEMFEGMAIPEEVVVSESQGFGSSSGRSIPMVAFLSSLQETIEWVFFDFKEQVADTLVAIKFGAKIPYTIEVASLVEEFLPYESGEEPLAEGDEDNPDTDEDDEGGGDKEPVNGNGKPPKKKAKEEPVPV